MISPVRDEEFLSLLSSIDDNLEFIEQDLVTVSDNLSAVSDTLDSILQLFKLYFNTLKGGSLKNE